MHDDTAGLQALALGEDVKFSDPAMGDKTGWFGDTFTFPKAILRITSPVKFTGVDGGPLIGVTIEGNHCTILRAWDQSAWLEFGSVEQCTFRNFSFGWFNSNVSRVATFKNVYWDGTP